MPAVAQEPDIHPDFPSTLIPAGYFVRSSATGDLNGDGLSDQIIVVAHQKEKESSEMNESWRELRVYLRNKKGTGRNAWKFSIGNNRVVLCKACGGMMGDPFMGVKIERGTFVVEHAGGSRWRWSNRLRFRLQKQGWALIGETTESYDSLEDSSEIKDHNLITGRYHLDTDKKGKKNRSIGYEKKPLRYLKNFDIYRHMEE